VQGPLLVLVAIAVPVLVQTSITVAVDVVVPVAGAVANPVDVAVMLSPGGGDVVGVEPPSESGGVAKAPPQPEVTRVKPTRSGIARTVA
jgi:adenosine/AMP kinase